MLKVEGITKIIEPYTIVENLSFTIKDGEIFGFLGPNGAGKSSTIKILTGLNKATSGEIFFDELSLKDNERKIKKLTGYVPETPLLYNSLTSKEYLEFIAGIYEIPYQETSERIKRMLGLFEFEEYADALISTYPKGVLQKLSLASAWLIEPKFLLLDEPSASLDPKATKRLKSSLKLTSEKGVCIFLTTHILEIAEALCDRIAIIDKGRIIAVGTMDELRHLSWGGNGSLEDIFLSLTGGSEYKDLLSYLVK
ncbi:ABC transporter ATP-binding protein [Candidatus Riflebacteria bacterium]